MKKTILAVGGLAGAVLLFASVSTDYDKAVDFGKYHSYSWLDVKAGDPLWVDRIRRDVDGQLQAKGWTVAPSGGDAAVSAFGSTKNQQTLQTFYDGMGGGWGWRRGWGGGLGEATTTVQNTPIGTLVVDVFDGQTKKLIWRGTSSETLSTKPDNNSKKLESDVESMFKKFPPPAKG
jgi:Domain of unknown function (DUF4136)